ncbi:MULTISPECIES: molybdenum cofactor biosynthesis protein MoaE [Henriciella]|jgi:molybdopterin synthase catalytic subunit|uniref:Molybdopterin synthase catalytic subunit n=1 Tax=Henriciella pelagia TaxID=1977912 RepID=A0ABQ1JG88_9PROT|nr:molybdenum cofactor biosynthesis protein MoaE [Henriciella pelagia]GGB68278.1 molybdenum cofactor biosynthesis protein MoaE [Henriciella pelagia]
MIRISDQPFDAAEALSEFTARATGAGAVVSFTGLVRDQASSSKVETLHLQAYSPMTETGIAEARKAAHERWPLIDSHIIHRTGDMSPGDAIVFVATASAHRRAAFEAADFLMDYLKTEAIFWKKETTASGTQWIEPRAEDYKDRARWTRS